MKTGRHPNRLTTSNATYLWKDGRGAWVRRREPIIVSVRCIPGETPVTFQLQAAHDNNIPYRVEARSARCPCGGVFTTAGVGVGAAATFFTAVYTIGSGSGRRDSSRCRCCRRRFARRCC